MRDVLKDLRFVLRQFGKSPGFTFTAVLVLTLGIGANTTIFSAVKAVLLDPLPYRHPERLVALYEAGVVNGDVHDQAAAGNFYDWQRESRSFEDIAAYGGTNGNLSGGPERLPEHADGVFCSWTLFRTLGVPAGIGRVFAGSDDSPTATRTIILSHSLWKRRFGADTRIIGRTLRFDAELFTVIGVMPHSFEFPSAATQFWIPMQIALSADQLQTRQDHRLFVIGRLRPGISIQQASAEMRGLQSQIARSYSGETGKSVEVCTLASETIDSALRRSMYVLWAAVGCVLLIACLNVANLLLTRGTARRKEVAVRIALGANKSRIIRLFLIEGVTLSLAGASSGVLLAAWLTRLLLRISTSLPRASAIQINWETLLFAAGLGLLVGGIAGALPAASASQLDLNEAMHESSRTTIGSVRSRWFRSGLVSTEIALSCILLIGAGLLLKSFVLLQNVSLGFNANHLLTMRLTLPLAQYPSEGKAAVFFEQLLFRVRALPGVQEAGLVSWLPVAGQYMNTDLKIIGRPAPPPGEMNVVIPRTADPGYFHAMGIPLERGRVFEPQERLAKADKAIVSSSLVRKYFPSEDAIGKYVSFWGKQRQIIGIVGDIRKNLNQAPEPTIYIPMSSGELNFAALVVRGDGEPLRLAIPIEREIARLDANLAVSNVLTMSQLISKRTANQHFSLVLLLCFAALAMLLAAVGLYAVVAYSTGQRTSEFGVRLALGASPKHLAEMVLAQALRPALIGMIGGLLATMAVVHTMRSMLFEVRPFDVTVFVSVGCGLLLVLFGASLVPALRTTGIDPAQTLRSE